MSEIDPDIGAAWHAASREQPPAALDERIRAAARREVGAGPGRVRAAPRWWPLAAAATVAAVAVGIVQMTPPEQVTPTAFPAAGSVAPQEPRLDALKPGDTARNRDAGTTAPPAEQRNALREEARPTAEEETSRAAHEAKAGAAGSAGSFAAPPGASAQDQKKQLQSPAQPAKDAAERDQAAKQKSELAAATTVARQNANAPSPMPAPVDRNEIQPLPASPARPLGGASSAASPMMAGAPAAPPAPAPAASPEPAPPPSPALASAPQPAPAPVSASATSSRKLAAQPPPSAQGRIAESASTAPPEVASNADALGKKVASADADKAAPERRKDAAPLAPDEWIKRIRRLIADGRNDDAARELAAFRRDYKDRAEALLPSDLRAFKP